MGFLLTTISTGISSSRTLMDGTRLLSSERKLKLVLGVRISQRGWFSKGERMNSGQESPGIEPDIDNAVLRRLYMGNDHSNK